MKSMVLHRPRVVSPVRRRPALRRAGIGSAVLGLVAILVLAGCGVRPTNPFGNPGDSPSPTAATAGAGSSPSAGDTTGRPVATPTPTPSKTPKPSPPPPPMLLDTIVPVDGSRVGVGMPIVVVFTDPVKASARKAIEEAMKLTATIPVVGAWHWLGDRQVDFRPRGYWPAGDRVTLDAQFRHVGDGYGRYGTHSYLHRFTIGSDFETRISVPQHTTTVYSNGRLIRSMPSDAGSPAFPSWDGTMSVSDKVRNEHMTSCSAGITCNKHSPNYYDGWYPWAVRLTYSGTFIHYSSGDPYPGHSYGSHGCVHLSLADAKWFFDNVLIGDPVTITGSPRGKASPDNGFAVYNLSWAQWQQDSGRGAFRVA